jgi:hypothetical protein
MMNGPHGFFRSDLCVAIEIPARLVGRGFVASVWWVHSVYGHAAEVDESSNCFVARNPEDVLGPFNIGSIEFIPGPGLPDEGGTMKHKVASIDCFSQRGQIKQICLNDLQWMFP